VIVADTNVVSELMKAEPSSAVRAWVFAHGHHELRITAITVAEILYGIERLPNGRRKTALREAAVEVFSRFTEDILPFDVAAATVYPEIVDHRDRQGHRSAHTTLRSLRFAGPMARDWRRGMKGTSPTSGSNS
jgi:hypothetical protein